MTRSTAISIADCARHYALHIVLFLICATSMGIVASLSIWGLVVLHGQDSSADTLYRLVLGWTAACGFAGVLVLGQALILTWKDYRMALVSLGVDGAGAGVQATGNRTDRDGSRS